jgi:acyl-CoA thioesterase
VTQPELSYPNVLVDLAVEAAPGQPGVYRGHAREVWNAPVYPSGGVLMGAALRAMEHALGRPEHRLRTATTLFVATVAPGPFEIRVEVLRTGRRMSQLRTSLGNPGRAPGHITLAAFGEARPAFAFSDSDPPQAPPPDACPGPAELPPGARSFNAPFFQNVEYRRVRMHHNFEVGWEGGRAEAIRWIRFRQPPRLPDGRLDPASLPALADTMPSAVGQFLGPDPSRFFHAPSVDLTLHHFADARGDWLLARTRAHWAGDGYASAATHLWDDDGTLVAYAAQLMLIRFPEQD